MRVRRAVSTRVHLRRAPAHKTEATGRHAPYFIFWSALKPRTPSGMGICRGERAAFTQVSRDKLEPWQSRASGCQSANSPGCYSTGLRQSLPASSRWQLRQKSRGKCSGCGCVANSPHAKQRDQQQRPRDQSSAGLSESHSLSAQKHPSRTRMRIRLVAELQANPRSPYHKQKANQPAWQTAASTTRQLCAINSRAPATHISTACCRHS